MFARDNCEPCGKNAVQLEAKMKRTPIRVEPISGKYFEIDSNKRSGAADVMSHPAIKRSAFAVVACEHFGLCRTITG